MVVLGLAGGFFVARRVLKRIDAMTDKTRTIMEGDLAGRLPVAGTGDELDRLAENLNAMLERIEALMHGLKEVSDNIAHDLKTPLTRLRNRCEEALRTAKDEKEYRAALENTLEESDGLIRTFNALLMIARAESGRGRRRHGRVRRRRDRARRRRALRAARRGQRARAQGRGAGPAPVKGNRELISQALANLIDNAIKYAGPERPAVNGARPRSWSRRRRGRPHPAHGRRQRTRHSGGRPRARGRALRAARAEPLAAGLGLGLSLASAVARLHGGELNLEDNHPGLISALARCRGRRRSRRPDARPHGRPAAGGRKVAAFRLQGPAGEGGMRSCIVGQALHLGGVLASLLVSFDPAPARTNYLRSRSKLGDVSLTKLPFVMAAEAGIYRQQRPHGKNNSSLMRRS